MSSSSFLMILYLFLVYLHCVWRAWLDERPMLSHSSVFQRFHLVAVTALIRWNMVSSSSFPMILYLFLIYICCVWRAQLDERHTPSHSSTFRRFSLVVATALVGQNMVSSSSFLMILYLFLIYIHCVWRAQLDERPMLSCSSAFRRFVL